MVQRNIINFKQFTPKNTRNTGGFKIKKNVASDILAPSADATHLHIARVRILRSVLSHRECEAISYETEKGSATAGYSPDCRASYFIFSESYVFPAVPLSGDQLT